MAPRHEEDWSDSDEEFLSGVETSVLLGIPDGPVTAIADIRDAAVSRMGGHPVRLLLVHVSFVCRIQSHLWF
jgi:pre-rRNA-processing protein TSR4